MRLTFIEGSRVTFVCCYKFFITLNETAHVLLRLYVHKHIREEPRPFFSQLSVGEKAPEELDRSNKLRRLRTFVVYICMQ